MTALFVILMWVPFRAENIGHAMKIYQRLFAFEGGLSAAPVWILAGLCCMALFMLVKLIERRRSNVPLDGSAPLLVRGTFLGTLGLTLLIGFTLVLMYSGDNPFIYFQF